MFSANEAAAQYEVNDQYDHDDGRYAHSAAAVVAGSITVKAAAAKQ